MAITLYIKDMVCDRCVKVVRQTLENLGLHLEAVLMGQATLSDALDSVELDRVSQALAFQGFALLTDKKALLVEKIKNLIIDLVHHHRSETPYNVSYRVEEAIGLDYTYLSSLFSASEGITIEKYLIRQRIERAKELLAYGELNLSEIARELSYSSVQHLSNQFKKITGFTPSEFRQLKSNQRRPLDEIGKS